LFLFDLFRLIQEVHDLHANIADLHGKLRQEENAIQHLLRTKSVLEQDLAIKNNSLYIDSDKVMGIRRTFTMVAPEKSSLTSVSFSHPRGLITA
jgi:tektin-3